MRSANAVHPAKRSGTGEGPEIDIRAGPAGRHPTWTEGGKPEALTLLGAGSARRASATRRTPIMDKIAVVPRLPKGV